MKLAEALALRADLKKRIDQVECRLMLNAKVQEGEAPAEDPEALLAELDGLFVQLERLMTRINLTNAQTSGNGESLTALLARRDCLTQKCGVLRNFLSNASDLVNRSARTEIKVLSTVNVQQKQKQLDALSKELRELDLRVQGLNWTTDLQ